MCVFQAHRLLSCPLSCPPSSLWQPFNYWKIAIVPPPCLNHLLFSIRNTPRSLSFSLYLLHPSSFIIFAYLHNYAQLLSQTTAQAEGERKSAPLLRFSSCPVESDTIGAFTRATNEPE